MTDLQQIQNNIYEIRGQKMMLDRDLATLYGVETKRLNEAVKRNIQRFDGDDFMFRLTKDETIQVASRSQLVMLENSTCSRSQNETLNVECTEDSSRSRSQIATLNKGRGSNIKYLPYAFTELGVAMLSSVLKSETAINVNREIMRAFVTFRRLASMPLPDSNEELRKEIQNLREEMNEILADQNDINELTRAQLDAISTALAELQAKDSLPRPRRRIGFIQDENK